MKTGTSFDIRYAVQTHWFDIKYGKICRDFQSERYKMEKIEWNDNLSVGIDTIDQQHKMLIQKLKDVSEAIESNLGEGTIAQTLDFLVDYTNFHFSEEEKQMIEHNYPGLAIQQNQHKEFKESLERLEQDFEEENATKELANQIRTFLFNWLVKHIEDVDLEFGKFMREKETQN